MSHYPSLAALAIEGVPRDEVQAREYQQLLERRHFPPRLRAYIGRV